MSEAIFKQKFRTGIERAYEDEVHAWTISDKFRAGSPDLCFMWDSHFFGVEAKYVSRLPARETSCILRHKVSAPQLRFLSRLSATGGHGIILIGMADLILFVYPHQLDGSGNITLKSARHLAFENHQSVQIKKLAGFFETVIKYE